uniref:Uncharacterized protein n=1 Tax=Timema cristinae TaxID=61476 RepID=A0A7R9CA26_TIMCR|nr:unnamed protein product [Timema cristinae]
MSGKDQRAKMTGEVKHDTLATTNKTQDEDGKDTLIHGVVRHLVTVLRPRAPLGREAERSSGKRTHYATPTPFSPRVPTPPPRAVR